jgi:ribosomal protein L11 methyltransferase
LTGSRISLAEQPDERYTAVAIEVPEVLADEIIGRTQGYTRGIRVEPNPDGRSALWIYLDDADSIAEAIRVVEQALNLHGLTPADCALRVETEDDGGWVARYQASLQPFDLGSRFTMFPSGAGEPREGREAIYLIPGRAFGTGEHPTTQLCIEMLERFVVSGSVWVDLGCGTGILSLAASSCGAENVLAIDDDPDAVEVTREVLRRNKASGIEVVQHDGIRISAAAPDGVVANIGAPFFRDSSARIAKGLATHGLLIASGILEDDLPEVEDRFVSVGLEPIERKTSGPWAVCVARRNAG